MNVTLYEEVIILLGFGLLFMYLNTVTLGIKHDDNNK